MNFESIQETTELTLVMAFADPTKFVKICEGKSSRDIFNLMSAYFELAGDIIEKAGGKIVKFMGDAVFVVFPSDNPSIAVNSLHELKSKAETFFSKQGVESVLQVKVHIGSITCGLIGTKKLKYFDVMGQEVNKTAMLQGGDFVISKELQEQIQS